MSNFSSFKARPVARAVVALLGLAAGAGTQAGPGFGDAYDLNNNPFVIQTYFAASPAGQRQWTQIFNADGSPMLDAKGKPMFAPDGYDPANRIAYDQKVKQFFPNGYPGSGKALRKFVDPLPLLGAANAKKMADGTTDKFIPVAQVSKWRNPQGVVTGDDYIEIAAVEYADRFHSDLRKATTLRGYVQIDHEASNGRTPLPGSKAVALKYPNGSPIYMAGTDANGKPTGAQVAALAYDQPRLLGPVIQAMKGTPTRVKFHNLLPVGRADKVNNPDGTVTVTSRNGDLFLPVDESITGAGFGPDGKTTYTQNRTNIHLHGGDTPWISDGGPHTWITPAGEADAAQAKSLAALAAGPTPTLDPAVLADYLRGPGAINVPDMYDPGPGAMTYYFPNGQSARMEWYHDHTVGITRLNAYAGLASAYILTDPTEQALIAAGKLPGADATIPLILGDRTFVPDDISLQDARWNTTAWGQPGDSWFPHVYETVQDPNQATNFSSVGRWHWGPWFWPSFPSLYNLPSGAYGDVTTTPEAWNDTPTINGVAYPTITVEPKAYRLRVLNASNDRTFSFNLFVADGQTVADDGRTNTEMKMVPVASWTNVCADGGITRFDAATGCVPQTWSTDVYGHNGGVPDPTTQGPTLYQIGNEGGRLPGVAVKDPQPTNFLLDKGRAAVLNVDWSASGLILGNAERADLVVDFSQYAGKTLLVYSDTGAPIPAADPRNEYFTGYGDNSATGGAEDTRVGYGPNSRTIMQIKVAAIAPAAPLDVAALDADLKTAYRDTQERPVVAQSAYNAALGTSWDDSQAFASIFNGSVKSPSFQFVPGTPGVVFNAFLLAKDANGQPLAGSGYTRLPTATVSGGGGSGATVTPSMKIDKIHVIDGGSGYKLAPLVTITSLGAGSGADAVATLKANAVAVVNGGSGYTGGNVASVTLGNGGSYVPVVSAITVTNAATNRYPGNGTLRVSITGGGGTGATATATTTGTGNNRRVTGITITNGGSGYTSAPTIAITGGTGTVVPATFTVATARTAPTVTFAAPAGGTAATATVQFNSTTGVVTGLTLTNAGSGYTTAPVPTFSGGSVAVAASATSTITAPPVVTFSAPTTAGGVTATGTATISAGKISGITLTNPGSGYTSAPTVKVAGTGTGAVLTVSGSVDAVTLTQPDPNNPLSAGGGGYTDLSTLGSEPNNLTPGLNIKFTAPTSAGGVTAVAGATGKIFDLTIVNPGKGYTSAPTITFTASRSEPAYSATAPNVSGQGGANYTLLNVPKVAPVFTTDMAANGQAQGSILVKTKAIQELFDPTYGRLNATFGVEIPYTSALTQTTIPLGYVDAPTEEIADGETQIWKITHNGVDTHPIHFHLVNVQLINRVGWDNFVTPPEPNELGWKETIKMSPLEDVIVAVRAKKPQVRQSSADGSFRLGAGFGIPNSVRRLDPSQPEGATAGFTQIDPATGLPAPRGNETIDFGWEYVWHCHILGHEENDFMRPIVFHANEAVPAAATGLTAAGSGTQVLLSWNDLAETEFQYRIERAAVGGALWTTLATMPANSTQYTDTTAGANPSVQYRVVAVGQAGEAASNTAVVVPLATAPTSISVAQSGSNLVLTWADASTTETSWSVQRATVTGGVVGAFSNVTFTLPSGTTATTGNRTATDNGAVAGTTYVYRVAAVNSAGTSAYATSAPVTVTVALAAPGTPTGLNGSSTVTTGNTATSTVNFRWTAPASGGAVSSYQVQRCTVVLGNCTYANVTGTFPTATSFQQTGVTRRVAGLQVTYRYRVGAVNATGTTYSTTYYQVAP